MPEYWGGCGYGSRPCGNCESEPQQDDSLFCSEECQDEYNGTGDFAENE